MFGLALRLTALSCVLLADSGQADPPREPKLRSMSAVPSTTEWPTAAELTVDKLMVHDQPNEASYVNNTLSRGDRVSIRGIVEGGWLAIDPPPRRSVGSNGRRSTGESFLPHQDAASPTRPCPRRIHRSEPG